METKKSSSYNYSSFIRSVDQKPPKSPSKSRSNHRKPTPQNPKTNQNQNPNSPNPPKIPKPEPSLTMHQAVRRFTRWPCHDDQKLRELLAQEPPKDLGQQKPTKNLQKTWFSLAKQQALSENLFFMGCQTASQKLPS